MFNKELSHKYLNEIEENLNSLKKNKFLKKLKRNLSLLLIPLFVIYITFSLNRSEVNILNFQTFSFTLIFLVKAFLISPIFILSKSSIFHFLKILLGQKSSYKDSIKSVLFASSLDVFTPAKINDFARLKGEKNKKFALYAIFIERLLDISTLCIFLFFKNYIYILIFIFTALLLSSNFLFVYSESNNSLFYNIKLASISIIISFSHWLIAFKLFQTSFEVVLNSLRLNSISDIMQNITITKFSLVTILGVLPISIGGIGIREAAAIKVFEKIDPSVVFASAIIYGLAISGSLSLLGILFVNINNKRIIHK